MSKPIEFYDSTQPKLIPAGATHVALYADGDFACPRDQVGRWERHILISVTRGDPAAARIARVKDIERYDATDADFRPFAAARLELGHYDALAYRSLAGVGALLKVMAGSRLPWQLWAAWWWGNDYPPTRTQVIDELRTAYGVRLPGWRLAGCQWQHTGEWDRSAWYGPDDFAKRHAA